MNLAHVLDTLGLYVCVCGCCVWPDPVHITARAGRSKGQSSLGVDVTVPTPCERPARALLWQRTTWWWWWSHQDHKHTHTHTHMVHVCMYVYKSVGTCYITCSRSDVVLTTTHHPPPTPLNTVAYLVRVCMYCSLLINWRTPLCAGSSLVT